MATRSCNRRFCFCGIAQAILLPLLAVAALAQSNASATGTVSGRVQLATGQYVGNARVSVKDTNLVEYTDVFGVYRLADVPAGSITLQVTYTGQEPAEAAVNVPTGGAVTHDVTLADTKSDVVTMQSFQVTGKEVIADEIAAQEQRAAPNIKNVISTDAFGDITGGTLGDFLKYVPGLTIEYSDIEPAGVSARGFGSAMTSYSSDGAPLSGGDISSTRRTRLNHLGLNNLERIEVTKVPTPAHPADSMGGSVNLVSKSAFDRAGGSRADYGVSLQANSDAVNFSREPISFDRKVYLIFPAFTFAGTWVVNKNLGVVVTADTSHQYNDQHISSTTWNAERG